MLTEGMRRGGGNDDSESGKAKLIDLLLQLFWISEDSPASLTGSVIIPRSTPLLGSPPFCTIDSKLHS